MDFSDYLGLGVDLFKTGYNLFTNKRDFDYQKALQQQIFEREDTAVQRRKEDLIAAGFNPSIAAGSGANAGQVVSRSNTNDLGSSLDTLQAINSIKQQKQAVENAKVEKEILDNKSTVSALESTLSKAELFNYLGLPYGIKAGIKNGNLDLNFVISGDKNKVYKDEMPLYNLFNYNLQNQRNSADLLQKDVDWYTADKVSGLALGFLGLGNSASGWRKFMNK